MSEEMINLALQHVRDILSLAIKHSSEHAALIVSDTECALAVMLTEAYRRCLPAATFIDFNTVAPTDIMAAFQALKPLDLVVLIQSTSFRLNAFRLRVELFERTLKVIEHPHLSRMVNSEIRYYIEALAYDPLYLRQVGHALKQRIDSASVGIIASGPERLIFNSTFEPAKLNIGDYTGMKNIGGQFPIGEVFTEAKQLEAVNGRVRIFAFGDTSFAVHRLTQPITLIVTAGQVTEVIDSIPEFDLVLENIRRDEEVVWLRELGFGMNRAFSQERMVSDIGTYERMCGIHLSLGAKHNVYKKPNFKRSNVWHHVDVFVATEWVLLDDHIVYQEGKWRV